MQRNIFGAQSFISDAKTKPQVLCQHVLITQLPMAPLKNVDKCEISEPAVYTVIQTVCNAICKIRCNYIWLLDASRLRTKYSSINMPGCNDAIFLLNVQICIQQLQ